MNLNNQRSQFFSFSKEDQRFILMTVLEPYLEKWENFTVIYEALRDIKDLPDSFFLEVYDAIEKTIETLSKEEGENFWKNMEDLLIQMEKMREKEAQERQSDQQQAEKDLDW